MQEKLFALSDAFWNAMKNRDGKTMYAIADPNCNFVHIGTNADLDKEVKYYTDGIFQPTDITVQPQLRLWVLRKLRTIPITRAMKSTITSWLYVFRQVS